MREKDTMIYLDLLPIGRRINYRGLTYAVKAVWDKGVVCKTDGGIPKILQGSAVLAELRLTHGY